MMKAQGIQDIPIAEIDTGFRLRPVDEGYAAMLAENIREVGRLRQPIEVRTVKGGKYRLIAGAHRLTACVKLGWEMIPTFVFEATEDEARLAEIDENLVRHELNPLDRATFLAERKALWEKLHPETTKGGDRKSADFKGKNQTEIISVWSFAKDTAERVGLTDRTIRNAVKIATNLAPDVKGRIAGTSIAKNQAELLALAKLGPAEQRAVLGLLLNERPQAGSVREAVGVLTNRPKKKPDGYSTLFLAWRHATAAQRARFIDFLRLNGVFETRHEEEAA